MNTERIYKSIVWAKEIVEALRNMENPVTGEKWNWLEDVATGYSKPGEIFRLFKNTNSYYQKIALLTVITQGNFGIDEYTKCGYFDMPSTRCCMKAWKKVARRLETGRRLNVPVQGHLVNLITGSVKEFPGRWYTWEEYK